MTEQEAIDALEKARAEEPESGHAQADDILVEFVRAQGFAAVADAYEAIAPKWYA